MYTAIFGQAAIIQFAVANAGALVTGLAGAAFTVEVVAPDGTLLGTNPAVTETSKAGVYRFTIPSTFFTAEGAGNYTFTVQVSAPAVIVSDVVSLAVGRTPALSLTYDAATNVLRANAWLVGGLGQVTTGVTNATFRLYDRAGTALVALSTAAAADAQGVFAFNVAAPVFGLGETETYAVVTVDDAGPPAITWRSITGLTFSRTS